MAFVSKGYKMMAFVGGEAIALATQHTLNISASLLEDRTKDDGDAAVGEFDNYSWTISADSVVGANENVTKEQTVVELIGIMLALNKVAIVTDAAVPPTDSVPEEGWSPTSRDTVFPASSGQAYIESLSISAGATGFATSSISFKGQGDLD
jgi:TP901-1 family phage major tail protein